MSTECSLSMVGPDTFILRRGTPGPWFHPSSHRSVFRDNCGNMTEGYQVGLEDSLHPRVGNTVFPRSHRATKGGKMVSSCVRSGFLPKGFQWQEIKWDKKLMGGNLKC